jgi:hypothetical protein
LNDWSLIFLLKLGEQKMDKKTTGIIATVAAALICGCCSLFTCLIGIGSITGRKLVAANLPRAAHPLIGVLFLCLSCIIILVPVAVGYFTLRNKPDAPAGDEPLPPAS